VKLIAASGEVYAEARSFIDQLLAAAREAHDNPRRSASTSSQNHFGRLKTIAEFRRRPEYQNDGNRIDLAYAIYALSHGTAEAEVRAAVASRDLSHKGNPNRQADYIERTIQKAWNAVHSHERSR
jgi:hypothetical protein